MKIQFTSVNLLLFDKNVIFHMQIEKIIHQLDGTLFFVWPSISRLGFNPALIWSGLIIYIALAAQVKKLETRLTKRMYIIAYIYTKDIFKYSPFHWTDTFYQIEGDVIKNKQFIVGNNKPMGKIVPTNHKFPRFNTFLLCKENQEKKQLLRCCFISSLK